MRTIATIALSHLRTGGRSAVVAAAVVGLALGMVVASVAGARRTETSVDRFVTYSHPPDIAFFGPLDLVDEAAGLPEVRASVRATYVPLTFLDVPEEERERLVPFVSLDPGHLRRIERPLVVDGRLPDPGAATEIAISEAVADRRGVRPGSTMRARTFAGAADLEQFEATGPVVPFRVTGIVRQLADLARTADEQGDFVSGEEMIYLTPAFWRGSVAGRLPQFGEQAALLVDLVDAPGAASAFERTVTDANGGELPGDGETAGFYDPLEQSSSVQRAVDVSATALYAFSALAGLAMLLVVGQGLARQARQSALDFPVLGALGLARRQLVAAAALRYALVAAIAAVVSIGTAVVLSPFAPFGLARLAEPDLGVQVNWAVIAAGAVAGLLAIVLIGAGATWLGTRPRAGRAHPSSLVTRLSRAGASAPAVVGTRFALEPGRGAAALPVRTTLTAGVMAAAALATAVTFSAGFDRVLATPRLQGAPWDIVLGRPQDEDRSPQEMLGDDERVDATARIVAAEAKAGGADDIPLTIIGLDGDPTMLVPLVRGRHPAGDDEVALTSQSARLLGAGVGETVSIVSKAEAQRRYRVVGMVPIDQQLLADRAGQGVLTTAAVASALAGGEGLESVAVRWRAGVDQAKARDDMKELFESQVRPFRSPDVRNLTRVRWLPNTLAAVLAVVGLATLGHSLFAAVRRRTRDLALLKTLGFDRAQVARTVRWQATTSAAVAAVVGLPIGVAAGRWIWRLVGERIGVVPEPVTPWLLVLILAPALLALAVVVSAVPARIAAGTSPARVLRSE
jgi:hypothetical protein